MRAERVHQGQGGRQGRATTWAQKGWVDGLLAVLLFIIIVSTTAAGARDPSPLLSRYPRISMIYLYVPSSCGRDLFTKSTREDSTGRCDIHDPVCVGLDISSSGRGVGVHNGCSPLPAPLTCLGHHISHAEPSFALWRGWVSLHRALRFISALRRRLSRTSSSTRYLHFHVAPSLHLSKPRKSRTHTSRICCITFSTRLAPLCLGLTPGQGT